VATTQDSLTVSIAIQSEKAAKSLDEISSKLKDFDNTSKKVSEGVGGFGASFAKVNVGIGFFVQNIQMAMSALDGLTQPFKESYDATVRLQHALELTGSKTVQSSIDAFSNLGKELVKLGVSSDEQVLKLAGLGTAAGFSSKRIEEMIKTSADLSVARDIPLETAFNALAKSLKGSSGAISQFIPELAGLTPEMNKQGVALDYLSSQYGGFAARNLETFSGKARAQKEALGELMETVGSVINEIVDLGAGMTRTAKMFESWNLALQDSKDNILALVNTIKSVFNSTLDMTVGKIMELVGSFQQGIGNIILAAGKVKSAFDVLRGSADEVGKSYQELGREMIENGKVNSQAWNEVNITVGATNDELKVVNTTVTKTAEEMKKARDAANKLKESIPSEESVKSFDELKKKVEEYSKALGLAGKSDVELAKAKEAADIKELQNLAAKIVGHNKLADAKRALLSQGIADIKGASNATAEEFRKKTLEEIMKQNAEITAKTNAFNTTQREQIAYELEAELKKLDIAKAKMILEGKASEASLKAIEEQRALLNDQASKKTEAAPSSQFEGLQKIGTKVAGEIAGTFSTGALGMIAGAASMVGAVTTAISALLDVVPNMLNSIAGIFNKITDFPNVLFQAFQGLFDSVINFVTNFLPNLISSIFKSFTQIKDFINNFVNSIVSLIDSLPDMIGNLIAALPEMFISLVENIIKGAIKLFMALAIKLPVAMIKALWNGISKIANGIKRIFQGKSFSVKIPEIPDVEVNTDKLNKVVSKMTGEAGKIFALADMAKSFRKSVIDPMKEASGGSGGGSGHKKNNSFWADIGRLFSFETLKNIMKTIVIAIEQVIDIFVKIVEGVWQALVVIVQVAFEFVKALWEGLKAIVQAAWEFVKILWDGLKNIVSAAWQFVSDLWEGLKGIVSSAWQFVSDLWEGLKGIVSGAFQFVQDIWDGLKGIVSGAFDTVIDFFKGIGSVGEAIAKPIKEAFSGIGDFFKSIGGAFKSLFKLDVSGFAKQLGEAFSKVLDPIFNGLKTIANGVIDFLNNIKLPGVHVGFKVLGKDISFGWDDIDLLPGNIAHLAKGGMVPQGTDTVPAMLTPGEFVINRRAVDAIGFNALSQINSGNMPSSGNSYQINFEINIDAKMSMDEGYIRTTLIPKLRDNLKRASLDGEFVLSSKGVRA
jgi:phage-related protein